MAQSDVIQSELRQRTADAARMQANRYAADESLAPSGIAKESAEALSPSATAPSPAATHSEAAWDAAGSTPSAASYQPRQGRTAAEIAPVLSPTTAGLLDETAIDFRAAARELRDTAAGTGGETRDSLLLAAGTYEQTARLIDDFRARCIAA